MSLQLGQRLGVYEVVSAIGAGGMGEVYRARDTRLHRDVALKILPDAFARDAERLARFEREAQVPASLNHTNIAGIYGVEEARGGKKLDRRAEAAGPRQLAFGSFEQFGSLGGSFKSFEPFAFNGRRGASR